MKYLITSDWHLRADTPRCRLDNFVETQKKILDFIKALSKEHNVPIYIAGDIFHKPRVPPVMESMFLSITNKNTYIMPGQHDIPNHNMENLRESSFHVISFNSNNWDNWVPFGNKEVNKTEGELLGIHELVVDDKSNLGEFTDVSTAYDILKRYPNFKYIVAGDNHRGFVHKGRDGRYVIVPGCITRQASDFMDYTPHIILLDTDIDEITEIPVPDPIEMVTNEYTVKEEQRNERILTFVESIKKADKVGLSFQDNLEKAMKINKIDKGVEKVIHEIMEEVDVE